MDDEELRLMRQRGPAPELTDAEVLTIVIWGEMRGLPSDAAIWRAAKSLLKGWFPHMVSQWNFVRRCANPLGLKDRILAREFGPAGDRNSGDGLPLPVCKNARAAAKEMPGTALGANAWHPSRLHAGTSRPDAVTL